MAGFSSTMFDPLRSRWAAMALAMVVPVVPAAAARYLVFVGTYDGPRSEGIYAYRYDSGSGVIEELGLAAKTPSPSFLALHPNGRFLYAANESGVPGVGPGGAVTAFEIDTGAGRLRELNRVATVGEWPCHLVVDATGRQVLAANYGGGSVVSFGLESDGRLGARSGFHQHTGSSVNAARQKGPHAHSINLSPDNRFALVSDLGLDRVFSYPFDPARGLAKPALAAVPVVAPGSGPRHLSFHPTGRFAYGINEMLSTIHVYRYAPEKGRLETIQTVSTLPPSFTGESTTAEVVVHPSGRFVYGSNRGHDSLAIFTVDGATGHLTRVGNESTGGLTPRNFNVDPEGRTLWAANQGTDNVVVFRVDAGTGRLERTGQGLKVGSPVCVKFLRLQ
jgi:6-phosphogluconolactonase